MKLQIGFSSEKSDSTGGMYDRGAPEEQAIPYIEQERVSPIANWTALTIAMPMKLAATPARRALERMPFGRLRGLPSEGSRKAL
jgi:hypothetical protein